ncbi:hypothetical protein [Pseudofrankia asymbiotica]|nr:hypothetical protein [Pseudofrankia asymbiotica]
MSRARSTSVGSVTTIKLTPGMTASELAEQAARLPDGAVFVAGFGDVGVVLAFGPPDGSATERDLLAAVVGSLAPEDFAPGRAGSDPADG